MDRDRRFEVLVAEVSLAHQVRALALIVGDQ